MSTEDRPNCCLFCGTDTNISTLETDKSHVISILHKLLQIPLLKCVKYLDFASPSSSSGTDWLILCFSCSSMVVQGHDLVLQLDLLHDQLAIIQTTLRTQIVNPQNGNNFMTKPNAEIFDQLKQDISRRRDPDNMNYQPIAKNMVSDSASFSPPEQQDDSIDDTIPFIFVEEIKIEYPESDLDHDQEYYNFSVDPLAMEIGGDDAVAEFIEIGDDEVDECENYFEDSNVEATSVPEPENAEVAQNETTTNTPVKKKRTPKYNATTDFSIDLVEFSPRKTSLQVNGYSYNFHKFGRNKRIWSCERQKSDKCNARLHTSKSLSSVNVLGELGTHNHDPGPRERKKATNILDEGELPPGESFLDTPIDPTSW